MMQTSTPTRRWAAIALCVFFVALESKPLLWWLPAETRTFVWKVLWIALCFASVCLTHRLGWKGGLKELGLSGSVFIGLAFGLFAASPMLVVYAALVVPGPHSSSVDFAMKVVVSAVTEEILFRGYLFLQLYRRAGWSFVAAVTVTGLTFGLAHFSTVSASRDATEAVLEIAVIGLGGAFYSWLLVRWSDNLWVPIFLHAFMNLWHWVFIGEQVDKGPSTNIGRILTVLAAIVITWLWNRRSRVPEQD